MGALKLIWLQYSYLTILVKCFRANSTLQLDLYRRLICAVVRNCTMKSTLGIDKKILSFGSQWSASRKRIGLVQSMQGATLFNFLKT